MLTKTMNIIKKNRKYFAATNNGYKCKILIDGVSLISGEVRSGGSMKNWKTVVEEGSVLRFQVPKMLYAELAGDISSINFKVI